MSSIKVVGGEQLKGEVKIQGSKNAALPILAATILNKGINRLCNCPKILDVFHMIKILEDLGCKTLWEGDTLVVDTSSPISTIVSEDYVRKMRCSILFLGALLGRCKEVTIAYPGGCSIGDRPIDYHLDAFKKMNVLLDEEEGSNLIRCKATCILGSDIFLKSPSVGATQNIILAAVRSNGVTRIFNAAREPEVSELCNYLIAAGAKIIGTGSDRLEVEGVSYLHDVSFTLSPDRIVAGTYMTAIATAHGEAILRDAPWWQLESVIAVLRRVGCNIETTKDYLKICSYKKLNAINLIKTQPYPGFPTDMQSQIMTVLCLADGKSTIVENIFESRFQNSEELKKMGAEIVIETEEKRAIIRGVDQLYGTIVEAHDLRGGAALVTAGLAANGTTLICNSNYVERGYEDICRDLSYLGAKIGYYSESILYLGA